MSYRFKLGFFLAISVNVCVTIEAGPWLGFAAFFAMYLLAKIFDVLGAIHDKMK